jgi:hypothetical protein
MSPSVRSKKMALFEPSGHPAATGHIQRKMVRINRWQITFFDQTDARCWPDWALPSSLDRPSRPWPRVILP